MNLTPQPNNDQLRTALHRVQTARAPVETLRVLREARTTWFDKPELDLRREIDAFLSRVSA